MVSISVFNDQVMGMIANDDGNYVLGKIENHASSHILYLDKNLKVNKEFSCETADDEQLG